jgi:hypothetical protein
MPDITRGSLARFAENSNLSTTNKARDIMAFQHGLPKWFSKKSVATDFTDQLDLFSGATLDAPVSIVSESKDTSQQLLFLSSIRICSSDASHHH